MSEKLHGLSKDKKKDWKCKTCTQYSDKAKPRSVQKQETSNVLTRKQNRLWNTSTPDKKNTNTSQITQSNTQVILVDSQIVDTQIVDTQIVDTHIINSDIIESRNLTLINTSDESTVIKDHLSRSMDCTLSDSITAQEMMNAINKLTMDLASTQSELDDTLIENNEMKRQIDRLT